MSAAASRSRCAPRARWSASSATSSSVRTLAVSFVASPLRRAAWSISRASAPASGGSSPLARICSASARQLHRHRAGAQQVVVQVGNHAEQLVELDVGRLQQPAQRAVAEQHHLHVERDRLRLELDGGDHADHLAHRLDADLAAQQRALERGPRIGLGQQLERVDQQHAAVGAVQVAGLDLAEVGHQHAEVGDVVDAADQVLQVRQVGIDHQVAVAVARIDQQVDFEARQLGRLRGGRAGVGIVARAERVGLVDHRAVQRLEPGGHRRQVGVARADLLGGVVDGQLRGRAVERACSRCACSLRSRIVSRSARTSRSCNSPTAFSRRARSSAGSAS